MVAEMSASSGDTGSLAPVWTSLSGSQESWEGEENGRQARQLAGQPSCLLGEASSW